MLPSKNVKFLIGIFYCVSFLSKPMTATLISNLNLVFESFNPISMIRFFEFNDKGWNITEGCIKDMFQYLDGLHKDVYWALRLYDASSYYSGGIYHGNEIRTIDPLICQNLDKEFQQYYNQLSGNITIVPFGVHIVNAKYKTLIANSNMVVTTINQPPQHQQHSKYHHYILQTVCMPKSCEFNDLKQVMSYPYLPQIRNHLFVRTAELEHIRIINGDYRFWNDFNFYILIALAIIILLLSCIATIYQHCKNSSSHDSDWISRLYVSNTVTASESGSSNLSIISQKDSLVSSTSSIMEPRFLPNISQPNDTINHYNHHHDHHHHRHHNHYHHDDDHHQNHVNHENINENNDEFCKILKCILRRMLLAFSWNENYKIFLNDFRERESLSLNNKNKKKSVTTSVDINYSIDDQMETELCGIRVLCTTILMFVHICTFLKSVSDNKTFRYNELTSAIIDNGILYVDTYFFISGISMAYLFYTTADLLVTDKINEMWDQLLVSASIILFKLLRLTVPYVVVLIVLQLTMKHFHANGILSIPSEDHITCSENMWKNLLYIETFFPIKNRCMIWTWYLSMEYQFCIIIMIVLLMAKNNVKYAAVICASFYTTSFVTAILIRYNNNATVTIKYNYDEELANFNGMLGRQPWLTISPYLMGVFFGYILHNNKEIIIANINLRLVICGWISFILLFCGTIFKQFYYNGLNLWIQAIISSMTSPMWLMGLMWIMLVSMSKYKGVIGRFIAAHQWQTLNKLTDCALLIEPLITRIIILNFDKSVHLTTSFSITLFLGLIIIIYMVALGLYLMIELPFTRLLKIFYYKQQ